MKPETIKKIRGLLKNECDLAEGRLLEQIRNGLDSNVDRKIADYREAYSALQDFDDWWDEQE